MGTLAGGSAAQQHQHAEHSSGRQDEDAHFQSASAGWQEAIPVPGAMTRCVSLPTQRPLT